MIWSSLRQTLENDPDAEAKIDRLRIFTKEETGKIREKDQRREITLLQLLEELSSLAEAVVRGSHWISREEILKRYPPPHGVWTIVAMGKFGAQELTYQSDLDLIFLYEKIEDQEFFTRLAERTLFSLQILTRHGYAYEIDAALRPSGNAGALVSSLPSFEDYHREMGRTWERQSLIKARPLPLLESDSLFRRRVTSVLDHICYEKPLARSQTASEIRNLRTRMEQELARESPNLTNLKTGRGGIVDIEFLVQFLQLVHGRNNPSLKTPRTVDALHALSAAHLLDASESKKLEQAYLFYREIETRLREILEQPTDELKEGTDYLQRLERDYFGGRTLLPELREMRGEVRALYERIVRP